MQSWGLGSDGKHSSRKCECGGAYKLGKGPQPGPPPLLTVPALVGAVVLAGRECTEEEWRKALDRGLHQSMRPPVHFLIEDFTLMTRKGQWVVMPYLVAKELPGLRLISLGVKEEQYRQPWWIGNYSYSNLNA